ncbi:MAG: tetratricopeptide repeat protein [Myxococcota bacterium]
MAFSKDKAHDRAEKYAAKGQHDRAAREYQSIVDHDPKDVRAWLMLADCLARTGDRAGAVSRYQQVADFYSNQREFQKALAVYRQVLNLDPSRMDIHYKCAQLNLEVGRVHDAIASFESIAQAQLSSGRIAEALDTYRTIADADPTIVSKRLRLAELYSREKMVDQAVDAFRQAGQILLDANRHADYVRVAERLVYHKPDDRDAIRQLARVYLHLGDARRALLKLNGLLQTDPGDAQGLELLAETFMALGKPDKASSVIVELVKKLREKGDETAADRALETGLDWIPGQADLLALQRGPAPAAPSDDSDTDPLELDVDDSDVVELDDSDFVLSADEPSDAVALEPDAIELDVGDDEPASTSMTDHVIEEAVEAEAEHAQVDPSTLTDFDKVLFEARVYVKYRLFEHALEHVTSLLETQPDHIGALSLQARSLTELERGGEAASVHARVAALVEGSDPKLANEHVQAALSLEPRQPQALAVQSRLDGAAAPPLSDDVELDLLDDDDGIAIDVSEPESEPQRPAMPMVVENRFGISEAGPLPEPRSEGLDGGGFAPTDQMEALRRAREADGGTPPAGFVARPPVGEGTGVPVRPMVPTPSSTELTLTDLDDDADAETGPISIEQTAASIDPILDEDSSLLELDLDDEPTTGEHVAEPVLEPELELEPEPELEPELELELEPEPDAVEQSLDAEFDAEFDDGFDDLLDADEPPTEQVPVGSPDPAAAPEPAAPPVALAPPGGWPDLSDDLAEIRFYVDQGLDDDAVATLDDLAAQHPGHPEIAKLRADLTGVQQPPEALTTGAQPLVNLDTDEDEDEDAYLSAIFSDEPERKTRSVEVSAKAADVEGSSARDHFDLGMAYREMGLVDSAVTEFEAACNDPAWQSRALVMIATLRVLRGETDAAVTDLQRAVESASNDEERRSANYELAVVYEKTGDASSAIALLQSVDAGYRDRDAKLAALQG